METNYDFTGWATRANLRCSDGRVIMKDAFKHNDGQKVPLVWNHQHNDPNEVLGHALLQNRDEGVYAYCKFNDTESGQTAKMLVQHGDVSALSIYANKLKQQGDNVIHGSIREVSLVLAGANPGAHIDNVIKHDESSEEEAVIYTDETISLYHAEEKTDSKQDDTEEQKNDGDSKEETVADVFNTLSEKQKNAVYIIVGEAVKQSTEAKHSDTDPETEDGENEDEGETVADVFNTLSEKQKNAVYVIVDEAVKQATKAEHSDTDTETITHNDTESEGGNTMKQNVFDQNDQKTEKNVLVHSDQEAIIKLAKTSAVGSLQEAIKIYMEDNKDSFAHGFVDAEGNEAIETLFPEYKDTNTGAPHTLKRDLGWVDSVMNKVHKSPYSRIRTRNADARIADLRAKGYQKKGDEKKIAGSIKLLSRTTDPQTVYRKDQLNRDDIIDITDFDVVAYQWGIMKDNMKEDLALSIMIGDGREDGDPDKIHETHIRSIWNDDDFYTIHRDVDIEAAKTELQGTNTGAYFSDNFVWATAMTEAALYAREDYKGSGALELYCDPHFLNVMLLARDRDGHRLYKSKADIAAALDVSAIHTAEQFANKVRTTADGKKKKLLGLFVNLSDYQVGCTKGGELTKFEDFDIDFNQYKYLLETRLSGASIKPYSAIALEQDVTEEAEG